MQSDGDMGLSSLSNSLLRKHALYFGFLGGVSGVLLDLDHYNHTRAFHNIALRLSLYYIIVYLGARFGRLLFRVVLNDNV